MEEGASSTPAGDSLEEREARVNATIARLAKEARPARPRPEPEATAIRLRLSLEMADAGIEMMRLNLRREHSEASPEEIDSLLQAWLLRRPGAEHGDSWGRSA